jgi:hypothetical protein
VLNKPERLEKFFAGLNLSGQKNEWAPHLLAVDQLMMTDTVSGHVKDLVGSMATDNPQLATKLLDVCRLDARLSRLGAMTAAIVCAKLHAVPTETRAQAEGAFLAWAVEREKAGWDVDADTGEIAVLKWRGRMDSLTLGLRMKVMANLMDQVHARLTGAEGDVGLLLNKFNWCVEAAKELPANHAECPVSLRLIIEGKVPMTVGDGNKVLREPVYDLAALDAEVLRHFGLALWPLMTPVRQNGKIVIANLGIGTARSIRILRAGELFGVNDTPSVDLGPGKEITLSVKGDPTAIEIIFTKFGKERRATLPVVAAQTATGTHGQQAPGTSVEAAKLDAIIGQVQDLKGVVFQAVDETGRLRTESDRRKLVIEEMADGPDKFLAGMRARITGSENLNLFMSLIEKTVLDGQKEYLSYTEIGRRLGGVTKQAIGARVTLFKGKYPEVWDYVDAVRNPEKPVDFSELAPSDRRKRGIDESYNYDAN